MGHSDAWCGEAAAHLGADGSQANGGGGLLVDQGAKTGLGLDDAVGDVHLAADGGQPEHELRARGGQERG